MRPFALFDHDGASGFSESRPRRVGRGRMTADFVGRDGSGLPGRDLPWLPILLYHRIVPEIIGPDEYRLCVAVSEFEAQMQYLKDHGYESVSVEELACAEASRDGTRPRQVAITFDDGYQDVYEYALPILKKLRMTATVFVVSSLLGGINEWDRGKVAEVPLMGLGELREMQSVGISIGSHGASHRPLGRVSADDAWAEMMGSKAMLEGALRGEVRVFSFPHGSATPALEEMARRAGYVAACGIERPRHRLFHLSRIDAATCYGTGLLWRWKVSGTYFHLRKNRMIGMLRGGPHWRSKNGRADPVVFPSINP